ncbi:BAHD acyltransferase At5g47980 [Ziziphus jujuba]|uniref:BAHD acyltransferase At5g47980 n=1 Tax=Ziziphus jujuba TaxID=326968 RepID=A0ABM3IHF1_ZIZJJ|nr:BAHD acyltransferase At5g47980 [Ziziphus jujuba]
MTTTTKMLEPITSKLECIAVSQASLNNLTLRHSKHFHPIDQPHHDHQSSKDSTSIPLLQVQASFFECGGLAIGLCMSHKLADAATMSKFISIWAAIAAGHEQPAQTQQLPIVEFNAASYFPPREHLSAFKSPITISKVPNKCVVKKRYVFDRTNIEALREKAVSQSVKRPSRVEAVTVLIWRCAMAAAWDKPTTLLDNKDAGDSSKKKKKKKSIIIQLVNIRKRFELYDVADFGWGKPIWISANDNNSFLLMDTKGGDGIEALVTLSEEEKALLEKDDELLTFATSNPSVS